MKLVTAPVPRSLAKRRQTTKNACSASGSAAARASSAEPRTDRERPKRVPSARSKHERDERHGERDGGVQERAPGARDDPVLADPPEDQREPERCSRARSPPPPCRSCRGRRGALAASAAKRWATAAGTRKTSASAAVSLRARRQPARELPGRPVVREHAERERRHGDDRRQRARTRRARRRTPPSSRARASAGSTATRTALAASTSTRKTP